MRLLRKIGNQPRARHRHTDPSGPRQRLVSSAKDLLFPSLGRSSTEGFSPREEPPDSSLGIPPPRSDLTATESAGQTYPLLELYKTNGKPADRLPLTLPSPLLGERTKVRGEKGLPSFHYLCKAQYPPPGCTQGLPRLVGELNAFKAPAVTSCPTSSACRPCP